mmetsp:Transcript_11665/g.35971  ORF Transcript_11665/g.35971 Transcript_11665/m.35971 type:complete len:513 (-) Transcript_11665:1054-2592(-)
MCGDGQVVLQLDRRHLRVAHRPAFSQRQAPRGLPPRGLAARRNGAGVLQLRLPERLPHRLRARQDGVGRRPPLPGLRGDGARAEIHGLGARRVAAAHRGPALPAVARPRARRERGRARAPAVRRGDPSPRRGLGAKARRDAGGPGSGRRRPGGRAGSRTGPAAVRRRLPLPERAGAFGEVGSGLRSTPGRSAGARGRVRAVGARNVQAPRRDLQPESSGRRRPRGLRFFRRTPITSGRRARVTIKLGRRAPARQEVGGERQSFAPRGRRGRVGSPGRQRARGRDGVRVRRRLCVEGHVVRPDADGVKNVSGRRRVAIGLPLPSLARARRRAASLKGRQEGAASDGPRPACVEPLPSSSCPGRRPGAAGVNPGPAWHGQDRHVGRHRLPHGEAESRSGAGGGAVEHRRRPADGEDPRDGSESGAADGEVARSRGVVRRPPVVARHVEGRRRARSCRTPEAAAAQGRDGGTDARGREAVPPAEGAGRARLVEGRGRGLYDVRRRGRPAAGGVAL